MTSETLTWDPSSAIYEEQDNAMTDYSGDIVSNAAVQGHVNSLVINPLSSLSSDKPRGASPLGQFLLVGPLFLCVEKVRGRK